MPDPHDDTTRDDLEAMVDETVEALTEIREELRRRRQAAEIDQLERHFEDARPKWSEIRAFLRTVAEELRAK